MVSFVAYLRADGRMAIEADRVVIADLLARGLKTEIFPRADTSHEFLDIQTRLRGHSGELVEQLKIAGFTDHTIVHEQVEQPCETCIYFLARRRWCDLPELDAPVEPQWSCRLWRV